MKTRRLFTFALMTTLGFSAASYRGQAQELAKKEKDKTITPAAAGSVVGSGTPGRISKWSGVSGSTTYVLGDSNIFEDKFGKVGIGTDTPTSKLTVAGLIETTSGGVKFPDGTTQTTAGVAPNDVVRSLNGLKGNLTLVGDANIEVTQAGNTITVAAPNVLTAVAHDATLTGDGTPASPLSVVQSEALIEPVSAEINISIDSGFGNGFGDLFNVPSGKRLVIEHVTANCTVPTGQKIVLIDVLIEPSGGTARSPALIPVFTGNRFIASQPIKLYADDAGAFAEVEVQVLRDMSTASGQCRCSFSGFLVSLPAQSAMNRSPAFAVPAQSETHVAGARQ